MAKYSNSLEYLISTKLDKTGISQLQTELNKVQDKLTKLGSASILDSNKLSEARNAVNKLSNTFSSSYDSLTKGLDFTKVSQGLSGLSGDSKALSDAFGKTGIAGKNAFTEVLTTLTKFNSGTKQVSSTWDKMMNTAANTVRWGATASVFQTIQNTIYRSWESAKELDATLNDIRIVSDYNAEDMKAFAKYANEAAEALGQTTTAYTEASLIFAQQGYDLDTSNTLADITLKTANVTGQDTSEVSEQLTALYNGFHINVEEAGAAEEAVDKLAKVAAIGAADLEELATAESKVASSAYTLGVSQDQLVAQISTIISVTRESAETVGNSLRTIYARLADLQLGETADDGATLGEVSSQLEKLGVTVLDESGNLRDMGDIIEDLMGKWNGLTTAEKQAAAVSLAGKYQYNRLMTLMENQDMYNEQLEASINATGTLQEQQDIYMESFAAKAAQMQAAAQGIFDTIFSTDQLKPIMTGLTAILDLVKNIMGTAYGDASNYGALAGLGGFALKAMKNPISSAMAKSSLNKEIRARDKENLEVGPDVQEEFISLANNDQINQEVVEQFKEWKVKATNYAKSLGFTEQERQEWDNAINEYGKALQALDTLNEEVDQDIEARITEILELTAGQEGAPTREELQGNVDSKGSNREKLQYLIEEKSAQEIQSIPQSKAKERLKAGYSKEITRLSALNNEVSKVAMGDFNLSVFGDEPGQLVSNEKLQQYSIEQLQSIKQAINNSIENLIQDNPDTISEDSTFVEKLKELADLYTASGKKLDDEAIEKIEEKKKEVQKAFNNEILSSNSLFGSSTVYDELSNNILPTRQGSLLNNKDLSQKEKQANLENIETKYGVILDSNEELKKAYKKLANAYMAESTDIKAYQEQLDKATEEFDTVLSNFASKKLDMSETKTGGKTSTQQENEDKQSMQHAGAVDSGAAKKAADSARQGVEDQIKFAGIRQQKQDVVELTASVTQLYGAWTNIKNLLDTLSSDDVSMGDKISAVIQTLVVLLPTLASASGGFEKFQSVMQNLQKTFREQKESIEQSKTSTKELTETVKEETTAEESHSTAIQNKTDAVEETTEAVKENTEATAENSSKDDTSASDSTKKDTEAIKENTEAIKENVDAVAEQEDNPIVDNTESIDKNSQAFEKNNQIIDKNSSALDSNIEKRKDNTSSVDDNTDEIQKSTYNVDENSDATKENTKETKKNTKEIDKQTKATKKDTKATKKDTKADKTNNKENSKKSSGKVDYEKGGGNAKQRRAKRRKAAKEAAQSDDKSNVKSVKQEVQAQEELKNAVDETNKAKEKQSTTTPPDNANIIQAEVEATQESAAAYGDLNTKKAEGNDIDIQKSESSAAYIGMLGAESEAASQTSAALAGQGEAVKSTSDSEKEATKAAQDLVDIKKEDIETTEKKTGAVEGSVIASGMEAAGAEIDKEAQEDLNEEKEEGIIVSAGQNAASLLSTIGLGLEAGAATLAKVAQEGLNAAINAFPGMFFITILTTIAGLLGGVIVDGITALATAVTDYFDSLDPNNAVEDLNNEAQELQQTASDISSEISEINSGIESIESGKETLEGLTKGSAEWYEQLNNVNQQVQDLIDKYPELAQYLTVDENGALGFTEEGQEAVVAEKQKQVTAATTAAAATKKQAIDKQAEADQYNFANSDENSFAATKTITREYNLNQPGVYGSTQKYTTETTTDTNVSLTSDEISSITDYIEGLDDITQASAEEVQQMLSQNDHQNVNLDTLADSIVKAIQEGNFGSASPNSDETRETEKNSQDVISGTALLSQYTDGENVSTAAAQIAGKALNDEIASVSAEMKDSWENSDFDDYVNQMTGGEGKVTSYNKDNLTYTDAEGEEQTVSLDAAADFLAAAKVQEESAEEIAQASLDFQNGIETANYNGILGDNGSDFLLEGAANSGEVGEGTTFDFSELSSSAREALASGDFELSDLGISEEDVTQFGYETGEQLKQALIDGAKNYSSDVGVEDLVDAAEFTDADVTALQESLDMTSDEYDNLVSAIYATDSAFASQCDSINNSIDSLESTNAELTRDNKTLDKNSQKYKDNQKQIEKNNKTIEQYQSILKKLQAAQVKQTKAAQKLSDTFADAKKVLSDTSSSASDVADAISDISGPWGDILDTDFSDWSNEAKTAFFTNTENLKLMEEALNGNDESLQKLRASAAKQVLVDMKICTDGNGNLTEQAQNLVDLASASISKIEAGATIEDTQYLNELVNMLKQTGATADDINTILGNLGVGIESITYKKVQILNDNGIPENIEVVDQVVYKKLSDAKTLSDNYTPSSTSPGGSGGSGDSGDSGSSYDPQTKDEIEDVADAYKEVDASIERVNAAMDRLQEKQDRLTGSDYVENLQKQIASYEKLIALEQERAKIAEAEAASGKAKLEAMGVTFGEDGISTNYLEIYNKYKENINSLIRTYNATTTEDGQDSLEEQIEDAQDAFDKFQETYDQYLDDLGVYEDAIAAAESYYDAIIDAQIEALKKQFEFIDGVKDLKEQMIAVKRALSGISSDDAFQNGLDTIERLSSYYMNAADAATYYGDKAAEANSKAAEYAEKGMDKVAAYWQELSDSYTQKATDAANYTGNPNDLYAGYLQDVTDRLKFYQEEWEKQKQTGKGDVYGDNSATLLEDMEEAYNLAVEYTQDLADGIEELEDDILELIDNIGEEFDKFNSKYDNVVSQLEHQLNMVNLIYGEQAYTKINDIVQAQNIVYDKQIDYLQEYIEQLKIQQTMFDKGSDEWQSYYEMITDAQSQLNDLVESSLENIQTIYENTVNSIMDSYTSSLFGTSDLDYLTSQWELASKNADMYLDSVNRSYETQKLQSKYIKLLNDTDGLATQQKITQQMNQQLAYLNDKTNLSEYDVKYAQAQLDILQKQIALEEAQRNKSQMKLKRDAQGNYSYTYVADDDSVADAEDALLDSYNSAYNLAKDNMKSTYSDMLSAASDFKSNAIDILTSTVLTAEEKQARLTELYAEYCELMSAYSEQYATSQSDITQVMTDMAATSFITLSDATVETIQQMADENYDVYEQIDSRFTSTINSLMKGISNFSDTFGETFRKDIDNALSSYETSVENVCNKVGEDFSKTNDILQETNTTMENLTTATDTFFTSLQKSSTQISTLNSNLDNLRSQVAQLNDENSTYAQNLKTVEATLASEQEKNRQLSADLAAATAANTSSSSSSSSGSGSSGGDGTPQIGDIVTYTGGEYYSSSDGQKPLGHQGEGKQAKITYMVNGGKATTSRPYPIHIQPLDGIGGPYGWLTINQIKGYDTGGYTGTWTSDQNSGLDSKGGRLALLHQKELILNATDTENILAAVSAVRDMASNFKSDMMNNLLTSLSTTMPSSVSSKNETIEQNITIQAEFPNANSVSDIQEALLSLNSVAEQYAYRK